MENISEKASAGYKQIVAANMSVNVEEILSSPAFSFDLRHIGPVEDRREEYLHLLCEAERARKDGHLSRELSLMEEANKLIEVKWEGNCHNTVMVPGKTDIIDKYFKGSSYTAAWYMLLIGGTGTIANTDTLASHPGWTEQTPYAGNRPAITFGTTSSGSNTATLVSYSITSGATLLGAGICSVNSGTSGTLYSASTFSTRTVSNGDTFQVTPTVSVT